MNKVFIAVAISLVLIGTFLLFGRDETVETPAPVAADVTDKTLDSGNVVGFIDKHNTHAWLGLPFVAPPVGDLRWKAPRPVESWSDTKQALEIGGVCPQFGNVLAGSSEEKLGKPDGTEDCLYLNVWAPADTKSGDLPVMVWIHGGGNSIGHGGSPSYNGALLASQHNVILISINYRLGPLGWFTHPALRSADASDADNSGNYGTLDIIAALQWVQRNAEVFGGDKGNVTIFGESAGGVDVLSMMASPLAKGLFHKAIVESGGLSLNSIANAENYSDDESGNTESGHPFSSREVVNQLLIAQGKAADRAAAKTLQDAMSDEDIYAFLHAQSPDNILNLYNGAFGGMINSPAVFADGHVLPNDLSTAKIFSNTANYNETPVILGTNRDEVKLFMMMSPESANRVFGIPYSLKDADKYNRDASYGSDAWKVRGVDSIAENLLASGNKDVFAYRFDWDEQKSLFGFELSEALGAAHGLEIAFVFGNFGKTFGLDLYEEEGIPARDALSKSMMSYWTEFAHSGNPGAGRDGQEVTWTNWQSTSSDAERLLILDTDRDAGIRMSNFHLTTQQLRDRFFADNSFEDQCAGFKSVFRGETPTAAEFEKLGGDCQF